MGHTGNTTPTRGKKDTLMEDRDPQKPYPAWWNIPSPTVTRSLTFIINLSITTGIFPNAWKRARVSPIFKEDLKTDPNNYRPISVLPVESKLIERVVF